MRPKIEKMLLIANPTSQNGNGAAAAKKAEEVLRAQAGDMQLDVALTKAAKHAVEIAAAAAGYDAVIALGGDGIIHETANGLMSIPSDQRPLFGIIPAGSGNDYARTLGMSTKVDKAVSQLLSAEPQLFDVGLCNGEYFLETLSFGLDAAIAADTTERRKRTGRTGTIMYLEAGVDQLIHHLDLFQYDATFFGARPCPTGGQRSAAMFEKRVAAACGAAANGADAIDLSVQDGMFMFGVQIGRTYGGGFSVCPDAQPDDGLFDICIAHPPLPAPLAMMAFLMAKDGHHAGFKQLEFLRAEGMRISFDAPPIAQMDGERIESSVYEVSMLPRALSVLVPGK